MIQSNKHSQQPKKRSYNTQQTYPSQINYQSESDNMHSTIKKQTYDEQFSTIYQQIIHHEYFTKINKHQKIRINKWLTKLSNISTNDLWKKNRNNYIKLIRLMFDCQIIIAPFLMMPPERDLHKLTPHQINVIIDQVDKLIDQRETRSNMNSTGNLEKVNKVQWTQQSAYINHHNSSLEKCKQTQNDCKRTYATSSVTANFSKMSENHIPPRHPSTTKHKSTQIPVTNKQNYFINKSRKDETKEVNKYFPKKQRYDTFETEQMAQQEYLMMIKNSSLQRGSPVLEKDNYNVKGQQEIDFEGQSRQAINILKCGFRLLQKIPLQSFQANSLDQMQTFRRILSENQFLKCQLQKENIFLQEFTNQTNRNALYDINGFNNTQKSKVTEKKKKLTLFSQPSHRI